ncbi:MAG: class I SAM-dependent DNA methyltransferase [bacterium]|nr:class I SAM-dependent DNA methyltransferase [bacterium]
MDRQTLSNKIWSACDIMRRDKLYLLQYIEQVSWMLFLKLFEQIERKSKLGAQVFGESYQPVMDEKYQWSAWHNLEAKDQLEFVNTKLFPYLQNLHGTPLKDIVSALFEDLRNNMHSPFNFKDVVNLLDDLDFSDPADTHIISQVYEELLLKMGQESGASGEFYTPRAIIRLMVKIIDPKIGERIYDPFAGSGGFLGEAFKYLKEKNPKMTAKDFSTLQNETFFGNEAKSLPFLLGIMNLLLHGLQSPHLIKTNTFAEDLTSIPERERFEIILTNPPFGGVEGKELLKSFPLKSSDTELLALFYVMKKLKTGGRCGIVLPEGILFRTGGVYTNLKKELLENFNLHTIISLPPGVFANVSSSGQGPKTNLLFFEKGIPTKEIWYYELTPPSGVKYTKKSPILDDHTKDAFTKYQKREISENSWVVSAEEIVGKNYDLSAKNPNGKGDTEHKSPEQILKSIKENEKDIQKLISEIENLI